MRVLHKNTIRRVPLPWIITNCSVAAFLTCVRKGDHEEDIRFERGFMIERDHEY